MEESLREAVEGFFYRRDAEDAERWRVTRYEQPATRYGAPLLVGVIRY